MNLIYKIFDCQTKDYCDNAFEHEGEDGELFTLEEARNEAIRHIENCSHDIGPEHEAKNRATIEKLQNLDFTKTTEAEIEIGAILAIFDYELEKV